MLQYLRSSVLPSKPVQLLLQTGMKWDQDNCPGMAASLSYFALFSLFPLLLVLLSVMGLLIGPNTQAFQQIESAIATFLPSEVHELIKGTLIALNENSVGAGLIGSGFLLWTASAVFAILRSSVNRIWRSPSRATESGSVHQMVLFVVLNKLFSFLLVLGTAALLLSSLVMRIAIQTILGLVTMFQEKLPLITIDELKLTEGLQTSSSFLLVAIATCLLFKILPTVFVAWKDVWLGALITASGVIGLQQLAGSSVISLGSNFVSYGVIGSVMILLMWIFLTFQIFLFGCVFTYIYAHLFGSRRNQSMASDLE
jgi:membrane protein